MAHKKVQRVQEIYKNAVTSERQQWEFINQKGFDFANDVQLTKKEKASLEEQGMPTFTINRIIPVVEMLNFYATANNPRWQAVGVDGSDSDVAAVFSDVADYIWSQSQGSSLFSNTINDAVTKSVGYMMVSVDKDKDHGMGEVMLTQPDPFDIFVDHKSRDLLFRDASYIMIRKILPKTHLINQYPSKKKQIQSATSQLFNEISLSEKPYDDEQKLWHYKDISSYGLEQTTNEEFIEFFELYERIKVPYMNVFYRIPPSKEQLKEIQQQAQVYIQEMTAEMEVKLAEQEAEMSEAVEAGKMLPQRYELEMGKAKKMAMQQIEAAKQEYMSKLQQEASRVENTVVSKKNLIY